MITRCRPIFAPLALLSSDAPLYLVVVSRRPQIARFLWCMIRLDLCHGASVDRLAGYISEFLLLRRPLLLLLARFALLFVVFGCCFFLHCYFDAVSALAVHDNNATNQQYLFLSSLIDYSCLFIGRRYRILHAAIGSDLIGKRCGVVARSPSTSPNANELHHL